MVVVNVEKLVAQQLLLCELKRRLEEEGRRPLRVRVGQVAYGPCLLLSRECGSQGDEVARRVGHLLGWEVFDREIVEEIAKRAHVRRQLIESADEHARSRWQELLHAARSRGEFGPETFLHYLHEIVLTLGHHGDVVIVGRGAQFLLPARCALRVRVVAPLESRVHQIAETKCFSEHEARHYVQVCDAARAVFIRRLFQQDTSSVLNYDLVLNMADMNLEAAAGMVLAALREKLGVPVEEASCVN